MNKSICFFFVIYFFLSKPALADWWDDVKNEASKAAAEISKSEVSKVLKQVDTEEEEETQTKVSQPKNNQAQKETNEIKEQQKIKASQSTTNTDFSVAFLGEGNQFFEPIRVLTYKGEPVFYSGGIYDYELAKLLDFPITAAKPDLLINYLNTANTPLYFWQALALSSAVITSKLSNNSSQPMLEISLNIDDKEQNMSAFLASVYSGLNLRPTFVDFIVANLREPYATKYGVIIKSRYCRLTSQDANELFKYAPWCRPFGLNPRRHANNSNPFEAKRLMAEFNEEVLPQVSKFAKSIMAKNIWFFDTVAIADYSFEKGGFPMKSYPSQIISPPFVIDKSTIPTILKMSESEAQTLRQSLDFKLGQGDSVIAPQKLILTGYGCNQTCSFSVKRDSKSSPQSFNKLSSDSGSVRLVPVFYKD